MDKEVEYRAIPGFPGYQASSDGKIWSFWVNKGKRGVAIGEARREIRGGVDKDGYRKVILCDGKRSRKYKRVHALILETFVGSCPNGCIGAHNDGNNQNNNINNLRWSTQKDNIDDKKAHGTWQCGENHGNSIVTSEQVIAIRSMRESGMTVKNIADTFNLKIRHVYQIVSKSTWRHV